MNKVFLYSLFIVFGTFISSISQVMLKKAAMKKYDSKSAEYLNPQVIGAYCIFFVATLCTIMAYKVVPLSLGAVLETLGYVYITFFGVKIFGEKINRKKIVALVLIIGGVIVFSFA